MKAWPAVPLALGVALLLAGGVVVARADGDPAAAAEPVMQQLEAFRRDDYDAAYAFASADVQRLFDRRAFERMVKGGYPEIARSVFALVAESRLAGDGVVFVRVRVRGANGKGIEAVYHMVWEGGRWRINGVVAKPDPGLV